MSWFESRTGVYAKKTQQNELHELKSQITAFSRSQAIIEFTLDGKILTANENFLATFDYTLDEIRGQHHGMFVDPTYRNSPECRMFWDKLGRGEYDAGQYKRVAKGGKQIWIQASYNPILDAGGKPCKVVKLATDITQQKFRTADFEGQLAAIGKAQAVIEFSLDGKVLNANENFLNTLGYTLDEIRGQHHSLFVDPIYRQTPEYRMFWDRLGRGEYEVGQYKRIGKGGREIWIQASYNPIMDMNGKPFKVVKYATDITQQKLKTADFEGQLAAIGKAQAVIEFSLDGKVLNANENFLKTMGYTLDEIRGQHHSAFVEAKDSQSPEYRAFWDKLGRGEYGAGQYKRIGKGGKEIWIQASYNPIMDMNGKPFKVIKYATDIAQQKLKTADFEGQLAAISKAQAVIEFSLDSKVLNANENFLKTLGYTLEEVRGRHHSMFVDAKDSQSLEYRMFWDKLGRGEYDAGQYRRIGKGGKEIWIQASYNPILDMNGNPFKVVKYATDVTAQVLASQALQLAVQETQEVVAAAKENDLTRRIPLVGKSGDIESLCGGINGLLDNMVSVISEIKQAAREVTNASAEISTSTTDLSQRTEEQAASLEETSASMEEIAATVKKNAENAQQANQSASATRDVADRGGQVVAKAVDAMARIEESSRKISDIIGVIDEIARQTNLLALNAAVEAARAGEAGRGFAVVASEVRSLAQRSSQAAKDIKDLITNSNGQVKDGVELVNRAGAALTEIVESIKKVAGIVSDIAAASAEQATGLDQINKALAQMDAVTQQNSALVEENAATAKTLEQQAKEMDERVTSFRIDNASEVEHTMRPAVVQSQRASIAAAKPQPPARPKQQSSPRRAAGNGGPVGQMRVALATAIKEDADWKEF
jgi:methyl-accepting chemotaxis protein